MRSQRQVRSNRRGTSRASTRVVARGAVSRAHSKLATEAPPPDIGGGAGEREDGTSVIAIPEERNPYARAIRSHEPTHINLKERSHTESRDLEAAVEDMRVQHELTESAKDSGYDPVIEDHAQAAERDVESINNADLSEATDEMWNQAIVVAARSLATLSYACRRGPVDRDRGKKAQKTVEDALGVPAHGILEAADATACGFYKKAKRELAPLFREPIALKGQEGEEGEGNDKGRYSPAHSTGEDAELDGLNPMEIIHLPRSVPTVRNQRKRKPSASGMRINGQKLTQAYLSGSTRRLFSRRVRYAGGTALIDASGSMEMDTELLGSLCRSIPYGTVAYYEGDDDWEGEDVTAGELVVYAKNGWRSDVQPRTAWMGNGVDYWALKWLLEQEGPRFIVTDGGFIGGPGQGYSAMNLLVDAINAGKLEWFRTVEECVEDLGLDL